VNLHSLQAIQITDATAMKERPRLPRNSCRKYAIAGANMKIDVGKRLCFVVKKSTSSRGSKKVQSCSSRMDSK
jgi:hypothetical protein